MSLLEGDDLPERNKLLSVAGFSPATIHGRKKPRASTLKEFNGEGESSDVTFDSTPISAASYSARGASCCLVDTRIAAAHSHSIPAISIDPDEEFARKLQWREEEELKSKQEEENEIVEVRCTSALFSQVPQPSPPSH